MRFLFSVYLFIIGVSLCIGQFTETWSTQSLSVARISLAATSIGDVVYFAGGLTNTGGGVSSLIDIYDSSTNKWTTSSLSVPRSDLVVRKVGHIRRRKTQWNLRLHN